MKPALSDNEPVMGFGPLLGLALLGGLAGGLSLLCDFLWPLALVCLAPLVLAAYCLRPRLAALAGLAWGVAHALVLLHWVTPLLSTHAGLWLVAAAGLNLLAALFQALYPAVFCFALALARPGGIVGLLSIALCWTGLEWLRGEIILKVSWQPLGQALAGCDVLCQTAEWWGVRGLSIIVALMNTLIARALLPRKTAAGKRLLALGAVLALLAAMALWGQMRLGAVRSQMAQAPGIRVMTAQAERTITQLEGSPRQSPEMLAELSRRGCPGGGAQPQLIVWPESAAPYYLFTMPGDGLVMKYLALEKKSHLILGSKGVVRRGKGLARTNRAWLIGPEGTALGFYDKAALAPFGEYSPLGPLWLLELLAVDKYEFARGEPGRILDAGQYKIGPLICFEALVPSLARMQTNDGAQVLVNISNEAWFIDGVSRQILAHMRMRCLETRRACARASDMGLSALIMPDGGIESTRGAVLCGSVPLMGQRTLYTRLGWIWSPGSLILAAALLVWARIRRRADR